jgi:glycosyltransferase involved in cell wall biosynthesis
MAAPELSAIVLCYRAEGSIRRVVDPLHALLEDSGDPYELVLVANYREGSGDRTPSIVEEFARTHPNVRFLAKVKHGGMGEDMRAGLAAAQGANLVVIDGDAQNPVEDLLKMHQLMRETGADVMKGRRIARFDGPYRRIVSGGFNTLFMVLFGSRGLWDINGKPKGISRGAYERMRLKSDDWFIDAEIVLAARRLGIEVVEMPVVFRRNEERASFVKFSAIWEFLGNMARARLRRPR